MTRYQFAALTVAVALFGLIAVSVDYDTTSGLFFIGLVAVVLAGMGGVCWYFSGKRGTLDDAYQVGYDAGFDKGRRVRPKVIRLERDRVPSSRQ